MLKGERRGWQTSWQRQTVRFRDKTIEQVDLHIETCPGKSSSGDFSGRGCTNWAGRWPCRLTTNAKAHVAAMAVPYAYGQMVAVWPGGAKRFASLDGAIYQQPGSLPQPQGSIALGRLLPADLDADCDEDLVLLRSGAQPQVWRNDGNGGFTLVSGALPGPGGYLAGAAADINRDGAVDLILATRAALILLLGSPGSPGKFQLGTGLLPSLGSGDISSVAVGFVNDDAHPDIVLGRGGPSAAAANLVLINQASGSGSFSAGPAFSRKDPTTAVALADLDSDGLHELVVGNAKGTASLIYTNLRGLLNQKNPWSIPGTANQGVPFILAQDLNNDCGVDLALASAAALQVWLNKGKVTFKAANLGSSPPGCTNLAAADVDGDGKLDLVLGGGSQGPTWLRQK